ncbi:alpha/beta fold hydrolase [Chloroflexus sp.]|uniref:alpha/beta fold hydrolase n=1 Tax=Chloroflexus sp. TaxID=1904827 RepID=UPI00262CB7E1|nr:alpha/beta hydrolase [uncultured Chloroflexus sp.]
MADETNNPIRRGRGLRITAPPGAPDEAVAPAPDNATIARGQGLRLSIAAGDIRTTTIKTANGLVHYRRIGEGPPLIAVHGVGASSRLWRDVLPGLADLRACYALDLPGCGASPARGAAPTLATLADEVIAFADALGLRRFDLIGHALGAGVAAVVAATRPARVNRLILFNFGARAATPDGLALALSRAPLDVFLGLARPFLNSWAGWALNAPVAGQLMAAWLLAGPPADPALWDAYLADHARADARMYITMQTMATDPLLKRHLAHIVTPTWVIGGQEDRIIRPADVRAAAALIARATVELIPGCGHLPPVEHPTSCRQLARAALETA